MTSLIAKIFSRIDAVISSTASVWRKALIRIMNQNIEFGQGVHINKNVRIRTFDGGSVRIGPGTNIFSGAVLEARSGDILIGKHSLINIGVIIVATDAIRIGDDALIAEYASLRDQDHGTSDQTLPYRKQGRVSSEIFIGDNVWLGAKVTVTRGVTIGDGIIVGSNSVVTRSLSGARTFGGVPARPLQ